MGTRISAIADPRPRGSLVQVDQEAGGPTLRLLTFATFRNFAGFLAVLAADGKRQRAEPALGNLVAALEAIAVGALFETRQRFLNLVQRLGLHLNQRELDVVL